MCLIVALMSKSCIVHNPKASHRKGLEATSMSLLQSSAGANAGSVHVKDL